MDFGVCLEMFFHGTPFVERIARAADAGFGCAEMWFVDATANTPDGVDFDAPKDADAVSAAADKSKVRLTNAVIGSPDGGLGGGLTDPAQRKEWLKRTDMTFEFCRNAGVGACIVCTGNVAPGMTREAMRASVLDGLKATAEKAEAAGIDLWLEPLNDTVDHPDYFCTSSDEAAALCREVGSERLGVLFDCYHMQIMEGDLTGHIERNIDVIRHFHSAGHPGRHELWHGETHYPAVLERIRALDYDGVFALEYLPQMDPAESLRKARAYLAEGRT